MFRHIKEHQASKKIYNDPAIYFIVGWELPIPAPARPLGIMSIALVDAILAEISAPPAPLGIGLCSAQACCWASSSALLDL